MNIASISRRFWRPFVRMLSTVHWRRLYSSLTSSISLAITYHIARLKLMAKRLRKYCSGPLFSLHLTFSPFLALFDTSSTFCLPSHSTHLFWCPSLLKRPKSISPELLLIRPLSMLSRSWLSHANVLLSLTTIIWIVTRFLSAMISVIRALIWSSCMVKDWRPSNLSLLSYSSLKASNSTTLSTRKSYFLSFGLWKSGAMTSSVSPS